jgi:hypothetical protein
MPHNTGMDWIRLPLRMAIYYRDTFDCVWCRGVFPLDPKGYELSLDHLDLEGGNEPSNLVTCCKSCNSSRQALPLRQWYKRLAEQGHNIRQVQARVRSAVRKPVNLDIGRVLAASRRPSHCTGIPGMVVENAQSAQTASQ